MLKSIKKYGILVFMAAAVLTSCIDKNQKENNYPTPGVGLDLPCIDSCDVYSIDTLLYMWHAEGTHKFTQDSYVKGIVTDDETSGNLYKASFIQDGDKAIELYMKSTSGLRIGDSIHVYLKGATLSEYSGTPQIQDLDPINVKIIKNNKLIEPAEISTTQVNSNYLCRLVKFNMVEFRAADRDNTFATDNAYGQFNLAQYEMQVIGNDTVYNLVDESIVVRTSNYASFAKTKLPQGNGYIIGILTYYSTNSVWQFTIRSISEVQMNNDPYEATPIPPIEPSGTGTEDDPYNIAAAALNQSVADSVWIRGYIVGSVNIPASQVVTNDSEISWEPPFDQAGNVNNVILADKIDERNINNCVIVSLTNNVPSNIRDINLKDHQENLGKILKVRGLLGTNYGKFGMKKSNEYELTDPE